MKKRILSPWRSETPLKHFRGGGDTQYRAPTEGPVPSARAPFSLFPQPFAPQAAIRPAAVHRPAGPPACLPSAPLFAQPRACTRVCIAVGPRAQRAAGDDHHTCLPGKFLNSSVWRTFRNNPRPLPLSAALPFLFNTPAPRMPRHARDMHACRRGALPPPATPCAANRRCCSAGTCSAGCLPSSTPGARTPL